MLRAGTASGSSLPSLVDLDVSGCIRASGALLRRPRSNPEYENADAALRGLVELVVALGSNLTRIALNEAGPGVPVVPGWPPQQPLAEMLSSLRSLRHLEIRGVGLYIFGLLSKLDLLGRSKPLIGICDFNRGLPRTLEGEILQVSEGQYVWPALRKAFFNNLC